MAVSPRVATIATLASLATPGFPWAPLAGPSAALAQEATPPAPQGTAPRQTAPGLPQTPPAPFKPDAPGAGPQAAAQDAWIFSGALDDSHETFSGTLLTGADGTDFEFKLGSGATCTGGDLKGEPGIVRLSEITCSDDRKMRALFVPQGGTELKVFGHVGEERFTASAHLLGTEELPEPRQSAQPKAPNAAPEPPTGPAPGAKPRDG